MRRKIAGWKYGIVYDEDKKTDPMLVSWDSLNEDDKSYIKESIKVWPEILAKSNLKIEKLKTLCYCEAQMKLGNK